MGKPSHLISNKKWNKKFQKNVRKFQTLANMSNGTRINKSDSVVTKWAFLQCILSCIRWIPQAISHIFVKLFSSVTKSGNQKAIENDTTSHLETRVSKLEKTLEEYAGRIKSLQKEVEDSKMRKFGDSCDQPPPPLVQLSVPPPALVCLPAAPPPPPPPPPPPAGMLSVQNNNLVIKKSSVTVKKPLQKLMRPAISLEDIISIKLKKTPAIQRAERVNYI